MIEVLIDRHDLFVLLANIFSGLNVILIVMLLVRRWRSGQARELAPLIPEKASDDLGVRRRRASKRWNERIKLLASFFNTIGAASFLAIVVVPMVQLGGTKLSVIQIVCGLGIAIGTQFVGQLLLKTWKTEE